MSGSVTRRRFVSTTTAAGAALGMRSRLAHGVLGANHRIVVGFIGLGGMGSGTLKSFLGQEDVRVAAVCDVHEPHREAAKKRIGRSDVTTHNDFRELLDRKEIDAVVVSTPDHWHALASIHAMLAGKDVYCEKPLTHRLDEGRAMVRTARKHQRITQMGTQIHAGENYHRVVEIVRSGILGKIGMVRVWQASKISPKGIGKAKDETPPQGLDWEHWLGPAPRRSFNKLRCFFNFRYFWDYANGQFSDFSCHYCDIAHWAMGVDAPQSVAATGGRYIAEDDAETPDTLTVTYHYAKPEPGGLGAPTGDLPPARTPDAGFTLMWQHAQWSGVALNRWGRYGVCFEGTDGSLYTDYGRHEVFPEKKGFSRRDVEKIPQSVPRSPGHHREFLDSIRSRKPCSCDFTYGHRLTSMMHLGNIALWTGRTIRWDPQAERVIGDAAADAHRTKAYHNGWEIPV